MARWGKLLATTPAQADLALLVIRLWFGTVLALTHGLGKISDVAGFSAKIAGKFPLAEVLGPAAAASEFFGGLLLALGLLTRPAAAMVCVTMATAAFYVHGDDPFGKKEFALAYAVPALALLLAGPGRWSVDAWWARRKG